jgi:DNA polymerase III epsilon subunit-like protein
MTRICFIDTETTSLRPDRRAWEIGLIVRDPGKPDAEHRWFVDADDLDLGNADVMSLKVGRFYERHPHARLDREAEFGDCEAEADALHQVEALTRGAHLVGAVPNFDAEVLGARMRAHGICPSWHYHLIDIEALAAGWLHRHAAVLENREATADEAVRLRELASPPWKSDELTAALGVKVAEDERHTALGDAKWARAVYDAVTGRTP